MKPSTAAIVLAAGRSSRMGQDKMLLRFGEDSVLGRTLAHLRASRVEEILVVIRPGAPDLAIAAEGEKTRILVNPDPDRGRTSSVKIGVQGLSPSVRVFLVAHGDMPCIPSRAIDRVLRALLSSGAALAVASYRGRRGHPVGFSREMADQILQLGDDEPLHRITRGKGIDVETGSPGILVRLDTPEDYKEACRQLADARARLSASGPQDRS